MNVLIATQNQGKLREYQRILKTQYPTLHPVGLADLGLHTMHVEETGTTFTENAILKAHAYAIASHILTLADDSGLVVDALHGAPGVYSARYGNQPDDVSRRHYLLAQLAHIPTSQRTARFVCVIAIYDPHSQHLETVQGTCEGTILDHERDHGHGFGYDPLFVPQGYSQTFGELDPSLKDAISHRAQALALVPQALSRFPFAS